MARGVNTAGDPSRRPPTEFGVAPGTQDHFPNVNKQAPISGEQFQPMVGPLTPTPNKTMMEGVRSSIYGQE